MESTPTKVAREERELIHVQLPKADAAALRRLATERDVSASSLIRRAVARYLADTSRDR